MSEWGTYLNTAFALLLGIREGSLRMLQSLQGLLLEILLIRLASPEWGKRGKLCSSITSPFLTVLTVQTQRNAGFHALSPQMDVSSLECWALTTFPLSLWMGLTWLLGLTDGAASVFPLENGLTMYVETKMATASPRKDTSTQKCSFSTHNTANALPSL